MNALKCPPRNHHRFTTNRRDAQQLVDTSSLFDVILRLGCQAVSPDTAFLFVSTRAVYPCLDTKCADSGRLAHSVP